MGATLPSRSLGPLEVSSIGLGCMPMSWGYDVAAADREEIAATLALALEYGVTLLDTADVYGPFTNEELIGELVVGSGHRDEVVIATKCGLIARSATEYARDGRPDHIRAACDASLRRLGVDTIDLYQLHRIDPAVPLEETWGAMAELVEAGKVRYLGLSEAGIGEIRTAAAIHPVASLQSELSLWTRDAIDAGILELCAREGIGFLAYAPLGRGYLTGTLPDTGFGADDFRSGNPRFAPDVLRANRGIVEAIGRVAGRHGATPAQIAIAWVLAQGDGVVPIPGTKRRRWLAENVAAAGIVLDGQDLADLAALPTSIAPRY